jgi:hypothetical protein
MAVQGLHLCGTGFFDMLTIGPVDPALDLGGFGTPD